MLCSVAGAITSLNNAVAVPSIITAWLLVFYSKHMPLDMPRPGYKITMMPTKELLQTKKVWISGQLFSFWLPLSILLSSESHWLTSKKHEFMQVVLVCCCWRRHPAPGNLQCIVYMLWVSARSKGAIATALLPQDVIHKSFQTYTGMLGDAILYIILICPCLSHTLNFPRVICIQLTPSDTGLIPTHTNIWQLYATVQALYATGWGFCSLMSFWQWCLHWAKTCSLSFVSVGKAEVVKIYLLDATVKVKYIYI